jgi:hypothetical protein
LLRDGQGMAWLLRLLRQQSPEQKLQMPHFLKQIVFCYVTLHSSIFWMAAPSQSPATSQANYRWA